MRNLTVALTALIVAATAACGGAAETSSSEADARPLPSLPRDTFQVELPASTLVKGDVTSFVSDGNFGYSLSRCVDSPCTRVEVLEGKYKLARVRTGHTLTLLDAKAAAVVDKYLYSMSGAQLLLDGASTVSTLVLAPVREDVCDKTSGSWSDDDATSLGFYCSCPAGQAWGAAGCQ